MFLEWSCYLYEYILSKLRSSLAKVTVLIRTTLFYGKNFIPKVSKRQISLILTLIKRLLHKMSLINVIVSKSFLLEIIIR